MPDERTDVAIVGGGIAGLAAAYAVARRGGVPVLLEAGPTFGGVIRTETVDGFVLEPGPDAMLAQKPEAIALCRELGLGDRLEPTNPVQKAVYVLLGGALHALPEGMALAVPTRVLPVLKSSLFTWPGKIRMGLDVLVPAARGVGDESIASFLRRRFGQEAVDRLGEPLLAGIHAGDPERLSIRGTFPRFVALEQRHGSLIRGLWSAPKAPPGAAAFYTLRGGLRALPDAVVGALPPASLRPSTEALALERSGSGFRVRTSTGTVEAKVVVVAVPAPRAASLVDALAPEAAALLRGIPFASTATVFLGYRREDVGHPLDGYGLVVPKTEGLRTSACSFSSTKFAGRAPEGRVLLRGFLGGARDPDVLSLSDDALAGVVGKEMGPVLGLRGEPVLRRVYRWPSATPQMEVGHLDRVAALERHVAAVPGLLLTGAGLRGTGLPDMVGDGTRVGEQAAALAGGA